MGSGKGASGTPPHLIPLDCIISSLKHWFIIINALDARGKHCLEYSRSTRMGALLLESIRKLFSAPDWMPARRVLQRDADWWNKLRNDCSVRFGFMPQKELSGKKCDIGEHTLYQFGSGRFISHQLKDEGKIICQMIVANAGQNQVYLALSRLLDERDVICLFSDDERQALPDLSQFSKLYIREHSPGIKEWVTMQYQRRIQGERGQKTTNAGTRTFQYSLFVNEANDKALEIEWFDDGGYEVYATIYRPVSDIVQVQFERPSSANSLKEFIKPPALKDRFDEENELSSPEKPSSAEIISLQTLRQEPKISQATTSMIDPSEDDEISSAPVSPLAVKEPLVSEGNHEVAPSREEDSLTCDIRVAAKIIDEALRNDMHLGDIVRRVLGLPVDISETVKFHVPLSDQDYRMLAERYHLMPHEKELIRESIVQDLVDFTGERETDSRQKRLGNHS